MASFELLQTGSGNMRLFTLILLLHGSFANAQLKFLIEDFEGLANGTSDIKDNGIFTYGFINASIESNIFPEKHTYTGTRAIKIVRKGKLTYGGWGKGLGSNLELDQSTDHLNFYVYFPLQPGLKTNTTGFKIFLQEDDNADNNFEKEKDDQWAYTATIDNCKKGEAWKLVSIPLSQFSDSNPGGDGIFNVSYKKGKLFTVLINFGEKNGINEGQECYFDLLCFSKGKLPTGPNPTDAPVVSKNDMCNLGAFSIEGNTANFIEIAGAFEKNFKPLSEKKLGVIHLFQPFGKNNGNKTSHYPSVERLNKIIDGGYIPMITLENHFEVTDPTMTQPNLYSIVEGHFDSFFGYWASQIKQVKGTVLLRMLHEFNGDWYPWCTVNNDKDPRLLAKAFCYIHNIFKENNVTNVKFIWCPNSMSIPQESWNYIMEAYPGDNFVDYVGLDVYNGAGKSTLWRSFRKEAAENYFILTEKLPNKPLLICETASRERTPGENKNAQTKAEWIKDMSETIKTDMSKICLISWFNERETFKVNSSQESKQAFLNYVMKDDHFRSGPDHFFKNKDQ
jgi:beta-mannanase